MSIPKPGSWIKKDEPRPKTRRTWRKPANRPLIKDESLTQLRDALRKESK